MKYFLLLIITLEAASCLSQPTELPRRALLGLRTDTISQNQKQQSRINKGVKIVAVSTNSTASAIGLQTSDILLTINNVEIESHRALLAFVQQAKSGDPLHFRILRNNKRLTLKGTLRSYPIERYHDLKVEYGHVSANGTRLRTIITHPLGANNLKAVLYVQGVSCGSIDQALDTANTQTQLINYLARAGFVVMRVDKAGTGDSEGGPCADLDFYTEAAGYRAALENLIGLSNVDKQNVYIVGHSMGGVWAPVISKSLPVKGIAVYGTIGTNYLEYIINSRRNVAAAMGLPPHQADDFVKEYAKCFGIYSALDHDVDSALKLCPDCEDELYLTTIRSTDYMRQLYALNIPSQWKAFEGKVLSLWGSADYLSVEEDHKLIATYVNKYHPGQARYQRVEDADHGMATAYSYGQAARNPGPFNKNVASAIVEWINNKELKETVPAPKEIAFPKDPSVQEILRETYVENAYPRWGASGKIIFQSNRDGHWQIYSMNADGSNQENLSSNSFNDNYVSSSADGKLIGFVSDRDGNEEIYIMNSDGSNVRRLTNSAARDIHPYFSPDGKKILFNSTRDSKTNFEIYSIDLSSGEIHRLTHTTDEETCARLSPDGKKIVLLAGLTSIMNDEILLLDSDGKNPVNLTKSPAAEGWPVWSPDGRKIYYASNPEGTFCIYEMHADGSGRKKITTVAAPFMDARPEISSDGKKLLFNRQITERNGKNTIAIYVKSLD